MGNLKKKWLNVMEECARINKDGYNSFQRYKYASAAGVMEAINPALVKNGIASTAEVELLEMREVTLVQETRTKTERLATVKVTVTLHDTDSDEIITISGIGGGQDAGDKAVMKAQTAAIKYAFMMALEISTGDDPEKNINTEAYNNNVGNKSLLACEDCGKDVTEKVAQFAKQKFGAVLCYDCQQTHKKLNGKQG